MPGVDPLPCLRGTMGGLPVIRSFWYPTPDELAALNHTGCVVITIMGEAHAPLMVGATGLDFKSIITLNAEDHDKKPSPDDPLQIKPVNGSDK